MLTLEFEPQNYMLWVSEIDPSTKSPGNKTLITTLQDIGRWLGNYKDCEKTDKTMVKLCVQIHCLIQSHDREVPEVVKFVRFVDMSKSCLRTAYDLPDSWARVHVNARLTTFDFTEKVNG